MTTSWNIFVNNILDIGFVCVINMSTPKSIYLRWHGIRYMLDWHEYIDILTGTMSHIIKYKDLLYFFFALFKKIYNVIVFYKFYDNGKCTSPTIFLQMNFIFLLWGLVRNKHSHFACIGSSDAPPKLGHVCWPPIANQCINW